MTSAAPMIGVVGDFDPANRTHQFTTEALEHVGLRFEWEPTDAAGDWDEPLAAYDGVWIAPASPYRSMDAAHAAVRRGRGSRRALGGPRSGLAAATVGAP